MASLDSSMRSKRPSSTGQGLLLSIGALSTFFLLWTLWSYVVSSPPSSIPSIMNDPVTFYDDPDFSYLVNTKVKNWDQKRRDWLTKNPSFTRSGKPRVIVVTGSQPDQCENPIGDNLLLRLFKNKVDYCRMHGCEVYYNNVLLDQGMHGYWAKYPIIRAAMMAHPEAEWIWWVDSDAIITDMDFTLPLEEYESYNLIVPGWPNLVFEKKSWTGLNAGVFLIRNCQWSIDFLNRWVEFGPTNPNYHRWGPILKSIFTDKLFLDSDDQAALAYIIVKENRKWGDKIYLESKYDLSAYWLGIVEKIEAISDRYNELEKRVRSLRKRHAEKSGESYRALLKESIKKSGYNLWEFRRPFVTHFTGCQPCSGRHNPTYSGNECWDGMVKALNLADNQVFRNFGYFRPDLSNSSFVEPISFN